MTYKRLSDLERQEIVGRHHQGDGIKELATAYGVSENTIRRTIKVLAATSSPANDPPVNDLEVSPSPEAIAPAPITPEPEPPAASAPAAPIIKRKVVNAIPTSVSSEEDEEEDEEDDLQGLAGEDPDEFDDDEDDEEEDGEDEEVNEDELEILEESPETQLTIVPLLEALLPRPCYVVVNKRSELLTRPLQDFRGLEQVSTEEARQETLPIFDSRPVALRYSQQNQRLHRPSDSQWRKTIIKVPDGKIFHKVMPYLQAKGITRVLFHGQVYAVD
ncbi:helix-turn-helix domain-containing protein [Candidatus Synechococcus calcipolaris G9]|uniref:Helix-turn-helix domain-containing protein n=1 Tax=Candidatus Synechococcus calcipolaris G9 TaxID=1497997 RepID=A0ABT6F310_9SYNE|nr:helix-turn-helix domain-containing protein [Candidatus Synechococcus calcipolaris]MDG2992222.1 helix-turn-helix domain-containing protein [Candidatus Synechococcus calcipolaris G9]